MGELGAIEIGFGCRGDEGEGVGVDCGAVEELTDGAVGDCLGGYGEYGDEVGEVLLDEGCVEAETTVGEVHCVPIVADHIRRPLLDTPQSVRNDGKREPKGIAIGNRTLRDRCLGGIRGRTGCQHESRH